MKKILSVLLAVMMLFGSLAVTSSAASLPDLASAEAAMQTVLQKLDVAENGNEYVIIRYDVNGGDYAEPILIYDPSIGGFTDSGDLGSATYYYRLPASADENYIGWQYFRPYNVIAPEGSDFDYWFCYASNEDYHPTLRYELTEDMVEDGCITLVAKYSPAAGGEDTLATIMNVLIKVFGAIVGILFYGGNTDAGIELLEKMIGGIM